MLGVGPGLRSSHEKISAEFFNSDFSVDTAERESTDNWAVPLVNSWPTLPVPASGSEGKFLIRHCGLQGRSVGQKRQPESGSF